MTDRATEHVTAIATLVAGALPDSHLDDLLIAGEYAGLRWTRGSGTGLSLLRFEGGVLVQSWNAARDPSAGSWPDDGANEHVVEAAVERAGTGAGAIRATLERYFAIRADVSRADQLREMFSEPMVVHGPGPTRVENLDEFVARVKSEKDAIPRLTFRADDVLHSGNRSLLRWSYLKGDSVAAAGLTLYAFHEGVVVERWQTSMPEGAGWV